MRRASIRLAELYEHHNTSTSVTVELLILFQDVEHMPLTSPRLLQSDPSRKLRKPVEKDAAESVSDANDGIRDYYCWKIDELQFVVTEKTQNLRRLEAQRNELNAKGKFLDLSFTILSSSSA